MKLRIKDLGLIAYSEAYQMQKEHVEHVLNGQEQILLLCEHPAVLTLGRLTNEAHMFLSESELKTRGVDVQRIDRGGDITLHAPGQLVVYPILNLNNFGKDLHLYLRQLEEVAIDLLKDFDIVAHRFSSRTGVWVEERKIVSIGIGVRKWISFHGLALNVTTDLSLFSLIRPCGLDVSMTSLAQIKGSFVDMEDVKNKMVNHFCKNFKLNNSL